MKAHNLNQVAIWLPMKSKDLDVKVFEAYHYMKNGILNSATALHPVIRYAKNYETKDNGRFSLCMITLDKDSKKVEAFLDKTAERRDLKADGKFTLTEIYYG